MEERLPPRVRFDESRGKLELHGVEEWQENDTLEKVSLLNQEAVAGSAPAKRWRTKSLNHSKQPGDSAASLWRRSTMKETTIDVDTVDANVGSWPLMQKKSSLPHLPESQIYSQSESEMSKDNSAMSSMRRFSQVDSDSTNSPQRLPALLSRLPSAGDLVTNILENPAFAVEGGRSHGEELGSLRLRKISSRSSQRHSFRDEELVVKASAVPASQYNRAKSRFAEPRKPVADQKCGSPRKSGGMRSGQLGSGPLRSQQLRSGNLWSGQLKSQMLKSGMIPPEGLKCLDEEEDDPFKDIDLPDRSKSGRKITWANMFEWIALILLAGGVVCSRVIPQVEKVTIWGLDLWKWLLLALVILCGRLVSSIMTRILVFILEINFLTRRRVLYFVYALRRGVRNCVWLAMVLISWNSLFDSKARATSQKLVYVTKVLQCCLLAACLFLVKVFLVKVLASSFHVDTYFERIRDICCVIDGVTYVVEEMNILTTVFLGDFDARVWYPNSVLATKPITNYYRSPDMGDKFEFFVDFTTTVEKIRLLKEAIGRYITDKSEHWKEDFSLNCTDCAPDTRKLKLVLGVSYTMNYHNIGEKTSRRSELMLEMRRLFQEIGIEYHPPPQETHLKSIDGTTINLSRTP